MSAFLDAHVVVRRHDAGPATLDAHVLADPGDVVAVIGPNGAGKTTLLRALAGLLPLHAGHVTCDGETWDDGAGTVRTVQDRRTGMVFQRQLLFPHLSAAENVAFGLRSRGVPRREARRRATEWLERLGVADLAARRPHEMSGGQAQRIGVARALATDPALLLLDEPLAALDVNVAMELRFELARHLGAFPGVSVLVTHDAIDTLTLATKVVVLDGGRVAQTGSPTEVTQRPVTGHVARLVGLNVLRGHASGTDVRLDDGSLLVTSTHSSGQVFASFSPEAVSLTLDEPTGSARNRWQGVVRSVVPLGASVRVQVDAGVGIAADVTPGSADALGLAPGRTVWAAVKATEIRVNGGTPHHDPARLPSGHV